MAKKDYHDSKYYENRELSWIKFNERVLTESTQEDNPLFEKLKFLSIVSSNLDEFIMVRVASLKDMEHADYDKKDISGMTVRQQLNAISKEVHEQVKRQYDIYKNLSDELIDNDINVIYHYEDLNDKQASFVDDYFEKEVYPVLTPMAVDSSRPFPLIRNKSLNIGALVTKKGEDDEIEFATVQVPSQMERLIEIPANGTVRTFILLEEVIEKNIDKLFLNYDIVCAHPFRIMRNADLSIEEDEAEDLLKEIERQVRMRQWGEAIRLEVEKNMDKRLLKIIMEELIITPTALFEIDGPLDLTFLMKLISIDGYNHLRESRYHKDLECLSLNTDEDIFEQIKQKDVLLFHPYETFKPVVEFIRQASKDPKVLAIKQTLYRVSGNSPIIAALSQAAENGKQVTVLVELKARFDEENNIIWAKRLEQAGCHVIYGLVGLKTHSKITLVVRREEDGIRRYVHLGTGNYNDSTAKLYTDVGLLTCDESIGEDATAVFNMLSGYSEPLNWNELSLAPLWLKDRFLYLIEREKKNALEGRQAHIVAKMNSVCDEDMIYALYDAAISGVKIDLIVRGICCIKVGIPELNHNIKVRSIVGNFLEHARIFYFENDGNPEYYCASADWMGRNLNRRVEIMFPIKNEELRQKLKHILDTQLKDNEKAHLLMDDGNYIRIKDLNKKSDENMKNINSQLIFGNEVKAMIKESKVTEEVRVFEPMMSINEME